METEVMMMPSPAVDFNFDSGCTTPYLTCPSSPQPFGTYFFSAPASPTSISASVFADLNAFSSTGSTSVASPSPNSPTNFHNPVNDYYDFEFNFTAKLDKNPLPADELFDGGKIRPIIQPSIDEISPEFPESPIKFGNFSKDIEIEQKQINPQNYNQEKERGKERNYKSPSIRENGTRSLSPYIDTDIYYGNERDQQGSTSNSNSNSSSSSSGFSSSSGRVSKKWRLRDLFRSSSEGRSATKGVGKSKYLLLKKASAEEDVKCSSFRSTASNGSAGSFRRRGPVELHYTVNRAMSEEMRKKTFLTNKLGLFGCMGFNPAVNCSVR